MNIDQAIKAAQERIHRSVGQRARFEKAWIADLAMWHRLEMQRHGWKPPERRTMRP